MFLHLEQFRCTCCDSEWSVTKAENVEGEPQCPICTVKKLYAKQCEIDKLENLLLSYRKVFQDLGIDNIKIQKENKCQK